MASSLTVVRISRKSQPHLIISSYWVTGVSSICSCYKMTDKSSHHGLSFTHPVTRRHILITCAEMWCFVLLDNVIAYRYLHVCQQPHFTVKYLQGWISGILEGKRGNYGLKPSACIYLGKLWESRRRENLEMRLFKELERNYVFLNTFMSLMVKTGL